VMMFDLSMLELSCCYCMIAWTVSVDSNEDYSKHTPFPSREVRPAIVTAPYYIPEAHDYPETCSTFGARLW
jgi:hypothetical protein